MNRAERIEAKRAALEAARHTGSEAEIKNAFLAFKREQESVAAEIRMAARR